MPVQATRVRGVHTPVHTSFLRGRIGNAVGHGNFTIARTCTYVMVDEAELDYVPPLAGPVRYASGGLTQSVQRAGGAAELGPGVARRVRTSGLDRPSLSRPGPRR